MSEGCGADCEANEETGGCSDDEVEFVGDQREENVNEEQSAWSVHVEELQEATERPVLEYIDLIDDDDNEAEASTSFSVKSRPRPKDHVDWQKARVTCTLDRLARHVEVEKKEREQKNKAFKEKMDSQHAHGLQELEFMQEHPEKEEARRCVDHWLKMPGLKPGVVNSRSRNSSQPVPQQNVKPVMCPIMNCYRMFDSGPLLLGHLKRFDHSPCDPTVTLKGAPSMSYACVVCCKRFSTEQQYNDHLQTKITSPNPDGHSREFSCQNIQCFACPFCYLLFNIRDECLQHMAAKNHFTHSLKISDQDSPAPVPFPSYAKKLLFTKCKEVPFQVKCTECAKILNSHVEVTPHFRTRCRNASPMAVARKSISQVAELFVVKGHCQNCGKLFKVDSHMKNHELLTGHKTETVCSVEKAVLLFCHFFEKSQSGAEQFALGESKQKSSLLKRSIKQEADSSCPISAKRRRESQFGVDSKKFNSADFCEQPQASVSDQVATAWFCECSQRYSTEKAVDKHIMAANQIFYKCIVCGKQAEDPAVIGLHMSRFHGGAHLNNYIFWCHTCKTEMPRKEDIMSHIIDCHGGHSFYYEQEVEEDDPQPSTSSCTSAAHEDNNRVPIVQSCDQKGDQGTTLSGKWQCRICEELFDSETSVTDHCKKPEKHSFQKYCCGTCKQRFLKVETLYRHFEDMHNGDINIGYFCGLCDSLLFDTEEEFSDHYQSYHSTDYVFLAERKELPFKNVDSVQPASSPTVKESKETCLCQEFYYSKSDKQNARKKCLDNLFHTGKLRFCCRFCPATARSSVAFKKHLQEIHGITEADGSFCFSCGACSEKLNTVNEARQHYHRKHLSCHSPNAEKVKSTPSAPNDKCCPDSHPDRPQNAVAKTQGETEHKEVQKNAFASEDSELPDMDYLMTMTHIVFVDLDNWSAFFHRLPGYLNQGTFVWGFKGGKEAWKAPEQNKVYKYLVNTGCFFLHPQCSDRKDAADFAICMHAGRLDEQLSKHIPFTILSGDKGFQELQLQFKKTMRVAHIFNPHELEGEMLCALLNSIADNVKDDDNCDSNTISEEEDIRRAQELSLQEKKDADLGKTTDAELEEALKRSLEEM
ncbi:E3 SUMO-protein ligase ZNF451 isoform X1 [Erpetoichthys calabaricus]|nr:E3 SUMO-protein ligase ZNF451 isoform X1 [Erpetoichthys calabaricus]